MAEEDSTRNETESEKKEAAVAFKNATESFMNLEELTRKAKGTSLEAFPSFDGLINGQIFKAVQEEKRVSREQMKELQKTHNLDPGDCLSHFFRKFEESFLETEKSEKRDPDGESMGLNEIKGRAIDIGIELTRDLVEFLLLGVGSGKKDEERIHLRNWILWRSGREDSEVFFLIHSLLKTAEELSRANLNTEAAKTTKQDRISGDEKMENDLPATFSEAILGLQSLVSHLQSRTRFRTKISLAELNGRIDRCEERLQAVKAGTKGVSGNETEDALREKMEIRIKGYWNGVFWKYISAVSIFRTMFGYPNGVYALCKSFVLDLNPSNSEK